jgi:hypothetical protein
VVSWALALVGFCSACTLAPQVEISGADSQESSADAVTSGDGESRAEDRLAAPPKVDILWVIDNGASMARSQVALGSLIEALGLHLVEQLGVDLQMAAVTTSVAEAGKFLTGGDWALTKMAFDLHAWPCSGPDDCAGQFGDGWQCVCSDGCGQEQNPNGSAATACVFGCQNDNQCEGESCAQAPCAYKCASTSGALPVENGCAPVPPPCPGSFSPVLNKDDSALFPCLAMATSSIPFQATMGQGLETAWMALDPAGSNAGQHKQLVRPGSVLLIIFVSNRDDCSVDEDFLALHGKIKKDLYAGCTLMGEFGKETCTADADCQAGWHCLDDGRCTAETHTPLLFDGAYPLASVDKYVQRFRSLKENPDDVYVAALVGDGLVYPDDQASFISESCLMDPALSDCLAYKKAAATGSAGCRADPSADGCAEVSATKLGCIRQCFFSSMAYSSSTYVCDGDTGSAGLGARYIRLAAGFGAHGLVANACSSIDRGGFAAAVTKILGAR